MAGNAVARKNSLTDLEVEKIKEELIKTKESLIFKGIVKSEEFNLSKDDLSDEVDQANADYSNSQRLRFRNREVFYVKKIDVAIKKIDEGTFGICEECECDISITRLKARPTAQLCIRCKEEAERDESNNFIQRQSKSIGTAIGYIRSI